MTKAVIKNAVKGKFTRKEEKWGEFVVTAPVTRYDFKERAVIDTMDVFKISVSGREYQACLEWAEKTPRDIEVNFYGETFKHNGEWKFSVRVAFDRFIEAKEEVPAFAKKAQDAKVEDDDECPFM